MKADALRIAVPMIRHFEGLRLKPYLCSAGVATIGLGSTAYENGRKVTLQDPPISKERAEALLQYTLNRQYLPAVLALCPEVDTPERLAALVDFAYNLGAGNLRASTLRKRVNAGDWESAKREILKWNRGGGRVLPGLVKRRQAESTLLD